MSRIIAAAILREGRIHTLPAPAQHHDIIQRMRAEGFTHNVHFQEVLGFLDDRGQFITREDAWTIVGQAPEIKSSRLEDNGCLF